MAEPLVEEGEWGVAALGDAPRRASPDAWGEAMERLRALAVEPAR